MVRRTAKLPFSAVELCAVVVRCSFLHAAAISGLKQPFPEKSYVLPPILRHGFAWSGCPCRESWWSYPRAKQKCRKSWCPCPSAKQPCPSASDRCARLRYFDTRSRQQLEVGRCKKSAGWGDSSQRGPRGPHPVGRLGFSCVDALHSIQHAGFPFEGGRYALALLLA